VWILVVGSQKLADREGGGAAILRELGCRVTLIDLFDPPDEAMEGKEPPAAILVEVLEQVELGRAALKALRARPGLAAVPTIGAVSVSAMQRLGNEDAYDDVVLVPYVPVELYVRIRRAEWRRSEFSGDGILKMGPLVVDAAAHEVRVDGRSVALTHQEFALLEFLLKHRGRAFSRRELLERVWGVDYYGGSRTVDIHVRRLRMKLGAPSDAIETIRGVGYKIKRP
jgi:DNA-binding response OmpR family regulator